MVQAVSGEEAGGGVVRVGVRAPGAGGAGFLWGVRPEGL